MNVSTKQKHTDTEDRLTARGGAGSGDGENDNWFFKWWKLPQKDSRAKRSLRIADHAGHRNRGMTLLTGTF